MRVGIFTHALLCPGEHRFYLKTTRLLNKCKWGGGGGGGELRTLLPYRLLLINTPWKKKMNTNHVQPYLPQFCLVETFESLSPLEQFL